MASRFRHLDPYRVEREWARYEGNALRDLFRELRARFLLRHAAKEGWVLDLGAGPGRFSHLLGGEATRTVLLDLSTEMLGRAREQFPSDRGRAVEAVRGDAASPPFSVGAFSLVAALGNVAGYLLGPTWPRIEPFASLVGPGGQLVLEVVPGAGERSTYLSRLPPTAVARVLRSPLPLVSARAGREGFRPVARAIKTDHPFRRLSPRLLLRQTPAGWAIEDMLAVAPGLGFDPSRLEAVRKDAKAWGHLVELEEALGRQPERWERAAALLIALRRS